ncbi:MAG: hypothetical protein PHO31_03440, partial [Candidatus Pacebacteria bacterium]|nr:hypothetical protein [Candidatus Paceibacterota bacterium]
YAVGTLTVDSTITLYMDGQFQASAIDAAPPIYNDPLVIGNFMGGSVDEIRFSNTARSPEWISTEYANQNDPASFYTIGQEENY